jgi:tetratricopeptide (TPR) repeat protein
MKNILTFFTAIFFSGILFSQTSLENAVDSFQTYTRYQWPEKEHLEIITRNATIIIDDAIKNQKPLEADIYKSRGKAYNKLNQYENALIDYNKVVELSKNGIWELFDRAKLHRKFEKKALAALDYLQIIELNNKEKKPDDFYAEKAYSALKEVSYYGKFKELIETNDTKPLYLKYYDSADLHFESIYSKDPTLAIKLLDKSVAAYRGTGIFLSRIDLLKARLYQKFGNHGMTYDGALFYYTKFFEQTNGYDSDGYIDDFDLVELAKAYRKVEMKKETLETYRKAYDEAESDELKLFIKRQWDAALAHFL